MDRTLWKAATTGDLSTITRMRDEEDGFLMQVTPEGNSALHIAAKKGHLKFTEYLVRKKPSLVTLANNSGDCPLHYAARAGHEQIVLLILLSQPLSWQRSAVNNLGNTALHEAVQNGHTLVVRMLLEKEAEMAEINNTAGISPLYLAVERGSVDAVKHLLASRMASPEGPHGQTALHAAVLRSSEIADLILTEMPGLIDQGDAINNSTPLHYAASHANINMVQLLLKYERSAAYQRDNDGFSAIHVAAGLGHLNVIKELLIHCPDCMEMKDVNGRNFLHVAIDKKRKEIVKYVLQSRDLAEVANLPDNKGYTALHLAVLSRNRYIIGLLSANSAVYKSPMNSSGDTPLDLASLKNGYEICHRMNKIRGDLTSNGSRFHPQRLDLLLNIPLRNGVEEMKRYMALVSSLTIVAVLIATVTFAAAFTMPGGYRSDDGTVLKTSEVAFKVFLISDTIAMVSSVIATFILINSGSLDHDVRLYSLITAKRLIWVALASMTMAFGTNILVVVNCRWVAILVCVISSCVLLAAVMATHWHSFYFISSCVFFAAVMVIHWHSFYFLRLFRTGNVMDEELRGVPVDQHILQHMRETHRHEFDTPRIENNV